MQRRTVSIVMCVMVLFVLLKLPPLANVLAQSEAAHLDLITEEKGPYLLGQPLNILVRLRNVADPQTLDGTVACSYRVLNEKAEQVKNKWDNREIVGGTAEVLASGLVMVGTISLYEEYDLESGRYTVRVWRGVLTASIELDVMEPSGLDQDAWNLLFGPEAQAQDNDWPYPDSDPRRSGPHPKFLRYLKCLEVYPGSSYAKYCAFWLAQEAEDYGQVAAKYPSFCYSDDACYRAAVGFYRKAFGTDSKPLGHRNPSRWAWDRPQRAGIPQAPLKPGQALLLQARAYARKVLEAYPEGDQVGRARQLLERIRYWLPE